MPEGLLEYQRMLDAREAVNQCAATQAKADIQRSREPWELSEQLRVMAMRYASDTSERAIALEASDLIVRLQELFQQERSRAEHAERDARSVKDKIHLALLALRAAVD